ncbi:hypothetical protein V6N13_089355 [Hibiscus sabdariffa]
MKCAIGVIDEIKSEILQHCAVGLCCKPFRISSIAKELDESDIFGFSIIRISGLWGSLLRIDEETPVQFECGCMKGGDGFVSNSQSENEDIVTPTPGLNVGMPKMTKCQSRGSKSNGRSMDKHGVTFCFMVPESVLEGDSR